MYKLNEMYEKFVHKWGVEPNGLLMSEETYLKLKDFLGQGMRFRGMTIFRSQQMEVNEVRFVL